MIMQFKSRRTGLVALLLSLLFFCSYPVKALTPNIDNNVRANTFLFVENNVDQYLFITPLQRLDPRMTGSNNWTSLKWQSGSIINKQQSLGYINGYTHRRVPSNYYYDMWLDNPPVNRAITALRCLINFNRCPADTGYIPAELIDDQGFYKVRTPASGIRWNHGLMGEAFYQYLRTLPVGNAFDLVINSCWTREEYDVQKGERCKDRSTGSWYQQSAHHIKGAHIKWLATGALAEIFIDSEGKPLVSEGNALCYNYTQSSGAADTREGLACKLSDIELQMQDSARASTIDMSIRIDNTVLPFTINAAAVRLSYNGDSWVNLNSSFDLSQLAASGSRSLYVFFSYSFFKQLVTNGVSDTDSMRFLKIAMNNSLVPESGYYEFTPSNSLIIKPRQFGVSIVSTDFIHAPKEQGTVGDDAPPIEFNYIVTTSGKTAADEVQVQVTGPSGTVYHRDYCLFSAENNAYKVPFPGYLTYVRSDNVTERIAHNCKGEWYDITDAQWTQTPWTDSNGNNGQLNKTQLKLLFPMDNTISQRTTDFDFWQGYVSASGEIRVSATWRNIK